MWKTILCGVVLFIATLSTMLLSPDFQYCENHQSQYPASNALGDKAATLQVPTSERSGFSTFYACAGAFVHSNADGITAISTLLLTLVTAGLVYIAIVQANTTRAQLRAYLMPESVGISDAPGDPRGFYWHVGFRNTGQTPAHKAASFGDIRVISPDNESQLAVSSVNQPATFAVGAGIPFPKQGWHTRQLTEAEREGININPPTHAIYVYGRVEYFDVFNVKHYTNYRYRYNGQWPPNGQLLSVPSEGNDAN